MNIRRLLLLGLIIMPFQGWAQSQSSSKINQLTITDTVLVNSINNLIQKEINNRDTANLFKKGYGYVMVNILAYGEADTLRKYYICPQLRYIKKNDPVYTYPDYYSYINKRLVLIYLNVLDGFSKNISEKEREKLRKRVGKTLEKPQMRTFYDMSGKEVFTDKHFRLDYIKFHGGVTVYELKNNQTIIKPD